MSWLLPILEGGLTAEVSHSQFSSVAQSFLTLCVPWITTRQASLSITNSQSLLKLMSIESVMPSSHLILCHPLLLLPSIPPSIRVFSNESALCMRCPKSNTHQIMVVDNFIIQKTNETLSFLVTNSIKILSMMVFYSHSHFLLGRGLPRLC